jgi:fructose-specific phosphotransferase system IIA component
MVPMPSAAIPIAKSANVLEPYLRESLFIPELRSKKKSSVLEELTERLETEGITRHRDAVLEVLRHRESLGSTGIGKGIAVPHGRSTLVSERAVVVARSTKGIDYDAVDGKPVHLCFLIMAPPVDRDPVYLRLLADIVKAVRLAKNRERIMQARDFATVRTVLAQASGE